MYYFTHYKTGTNTVRSLCERFRALPKSIRGKKAENLLTTENKGNAKHEEVIWPAQKGQREEKFKRFPHDVYFSFFCVILFVLKRLNKKMSFLSLAKTLRSRDRARVVHGSCMAISLKSTASNSKPSVFQQVSDR